MRVELNPPSTTNEELAFHLWAEEVMAEEIYQGRDMFTLYMVIEVSRLLMCS